MISSVCARACVSLSAEKPVSDFMIVLRFAFCLRACVWVRTCKPVPPSASLLLISFCSSYFFFYFAPTLQSCTLERVGVFYGPQCAPSSSFGTEVKTFFILFNVNILWFLWKFINCWLFRRAECKKKCRIIALSLSFMSCYVVTF